ncbi:unnamed protein product [Amoebophrya sp. A25]|nr:unnamed protein product [Amoebophrya sp. A25]|eukprot:GSA25T00019735001.1
MAQLLEHFRDRLPCGGCIREDGCVEEGNLAHQLRQIERPENFPVGVRDEGETETRGLGQTGERQQGRLGVEGNRVVTSSSSSSSRTTGGAGEAVRRGAPCCTTIDRNANNSGVTGRTTPPVSGSARSRSTSGGAAVAPSSTSPRGVELQLSMLRPRTREGAFDSCGVFGSRPKWKNGYAYDYQHQRRISLGTETDYEAINASQQLQGEVLPPSRSTTLNSTYSTETTVSSESSYNSTITASWWSSGNERSRRRGDNIDAIHQQVFDSDIALLILDFVLVPDNVARLSRVNKRFAFFCRKLVGGRLPIRHCEFKACRRVFVTEKHQWQLEAAFTASAAGKHLLDDSNGSFGFGSAHQVVEDVDFSSRSTSVAVLPVGLWSQSVPSSPTAGERATGRPLLSLKGCGGAQVQILSYVPDAQVKAICKNRRRMQMRAMKKKKNQEQLLSTNVGRRCSVGGTHGAVARTSSANHKSTTRDRAFSLSSMSTSMSTSAASPGSLQTSLISDEGVPLELCGLDEDGEHESQGCRDHSTGSTSTLFYQPDLQEHDQGVERQRSHQDHGEENQQMTDAHGAQRDPLTLFQSPSRTAGISSRIHNLFTTTAANHNGSDSEAERHQRDFEEAENVILKGRIILQHKLPMNSTFIPIGRFENHVCYRTFLFVLLDEEEPEEGEHDDPELQVVDERDQGIYSASSAFLPIFSPPVSSSNNKIRRIVLLSMDQMESLASRRVFACLTPRPEAMVDLGVATPMHRY